MRRTSSSPSSPTSSPTSSPVQKRARTDAPPVTAQPGHTGLDLPLDTLAAFTPLDVPSPPSRFLPEPSPLTQALHALAQTVAQLPREEAGRRTIGPLMALLPDVNTPHDMALVMKMVDEDLLLQHPELLLSITRQLAPATHTDIDLLCTTANRCLDAAAHSPVREAVWLHLMQEVPHLDLVAAIELFNCLTNDDRESQTPPALLENVAGMTEAIMERAQGTVPDPDSDDLPDLPESPARQADALALVRTDPRPVAPHSPPLPSEIAQKIGLDLLHGEQDRLWACMPMPAMSWQTEHRWKLVGRQLCHWALAQRSHQAGMKPVLAAIRWEVTLRKLDHFPLRLTRLNTLHILHDPTYEAMRYVPVSPGAALHRLDQLLCRAFSRALSQMPFIDGPITNASVSDALATHAQQALADTFGQFAELALARMRSQGQGLSHTDYVALTHLPARAFVMARRLTHEKQREAVFKAMAEVLFRHLDAFPVEVQFDALMDLIFSSRRHTDVVKLAAQHIRALYTRLPGAEALARQIEKLVRAPATVDGPDVDACLARLSLPTQNWGNAAFAQLRAILEHHRTPAREALIVRCVVNLLGELGRLADLESGINAWINALDLPTELLHAAVRQMPPVDRLHLFTDPPIGAIVPLIESLADDETIPLAERVELLRLAMRQAGVTIGLPGDPSERLARRLDALRQRQDSSTQV